MTTTHDTITSSMKSLQSFTHEVRGGTNHYSAKLPSKGSGVLMVSIYETLGFVDIRVVSPAYHKLVLRNDEDHLKTIRDTIYALRTGVAVNVEGGTSVHTCTVGGHSIAVVFDDLTTTVYSSSGRTYTFNQSETDWLGRDPSLYRYSRPPEDDIAAIIKEVKRQ